MHIINKLLEGGEGLIRIKDIKNYILTQIPGIYYKNIIVIKDGKVLDDNILAIETGYNYAIIPIKCDLHLTINSPK